MASPLLTTIYEKLWSIKRSVEYVLLFTFLFRQYLDKICTPFTLQSFVTTFCPQFVSISFRFNTVLHSVKWLMCLENCDSVPEEVS